MKLFSSVVTLFLSTFTAFAADKVSFGMNWTAQPEHGGFHQALVDGTYARYGLEVTIVPGGPQTNNRLLLAAGRLDFYMGGNMLQPFEAAARGIPTVVVAALFQKDPQILMSHPGQGLDRFEDLKRAPIFVSKLTLASTYRWLVTEHGFKEENTRPYAFSAAPFLSDKKTVQQGYVTSEPFKIEREGGFRPNIFMLADHGFDSYATLIETRREIVERRPDVVRRFVEASILGWYNYLYGDNAAANAEIRRLNPDLSPEAIAYAIEAMKRHGIVDSGDAETLGIGAMSEVRVRSFFERMARSGLVDASTDWRRSYTTDFVNKGVGRELRKQ
jgi:NitT/TauT family transport system substrate-binding protein